MNHPEIEYDAGELYLARTFHSLGRYTRELLRHTLAVPNLATLASNAMQSVSHSRPLPRQHDDLMSLSTRITFVRR